ncbi:scarecrow-like protein 8 [Rutidosis leptorrhynchoides]|uniref:scarecrow-like protein 8 n=1 Tax=Rutidosis leptorrhynchoides TaxID=125765 RepID=UPI003A99A0AC
MSSGYPGGHPDYFNLNTNNNITPRSIPMMNLNHNYRSPLAGIVVDQSSRQPDLIGKRSLAEFQHHQQLQQQAAFYLRNVKQKPSINNHNNIMDFSTAPEVSSLSNMTSSFSTIPRYGVPLLHQQQIHHPLNVHKLNFNRYSLPQLSQKQETEGKMMKQLQELEKQLLLDDEDDGENDVSGVTNSEWSETIQNILSPPVATKPENIVSPSPTSSSSSSCASSSASPAMLVCSKQLLSEAAGALSEGKTEVANEILTRLNHVSNARGTPEQRLSYYMTAALRSRMQLGATTVSELYGKDHILSTQLLYDKSPCFKLGFMAANATILEAGKKIHIVDFDIGQGLQYVNLLREVAAAREAREGCEGENGTPFTIKLTTFQDFGNGGIENLKHVGEGLQSLANKLGVMFSFNILNLKISEVNTTSLMVESGEVLVVNFCFKLYKLPDESVTTENLRDEVLRRVKGLSPDLVTVVEQELNMNTASFETRVSQACGYYGALIESLDATIGRENMYRVKLEEGLSRKIMNSVACEGRDRVERCEVFGKWRARMSMAGFKMSQLSVESLLTKVNSVTRGNPGFTVKEEGGGISLGWMGRTLTVASAWN